MPDYRRYTDFILLLDDFVPETGAYTVQLLPGPDWGEPPKAFLDLKYPDIAPMLEALEADETDGAQLLTLGKALAERLLPAGPLRDAFLDAVRIRSSNEGLRVRLQIRAPILQQIPWEYCWLETQQAKEERSNFIVLNPKISVVRHPPISEPLAPLQMGERKTLRLLAGMANPRIPRVNPLNLTVEKRVLQSVFKKLKTVEWEPILENLDEAALDTALAKKPDLFHFSGHGVYSAAEQEGSLVLVENGAAQKKEPAILSASILAKKLALGGVRFAFLGACETSRVGGVSPWTGIAPALVAGGVPAVVAMQYRIDDQSAIVFSRAFYTSLLAGLTIDEAVAAGRIAVFGQSGEDDVQWGVPTLYLRAEKGLLFADMPENKDNFIDRTALLAYLQQIEEEFARSRPTNQRLVPLYSQAFYVRPAGHVAAEPMKLDDLMDSILDNPEVGGWARSIVLLAENGVGKTPALHGLFHRSVQRALISAEMPEKSPSGRFTVPFFVSLSNLHGDMFQLILNAFREYYGRSLGAADITVQDLTQLLNKNNCLLFLDGLDELPASNTLGGIEILRQFAAGHPRLRFIYTCRTINYRGQLGRAEAMEIDLLTEAQVRTVLGAVAYEALPDTLKRLARYRSMLEKLIGLEIESSNIKSKGQLIRSLVLERTGLDGESDKTPSIPLVAMESLLERLAYTMQREAVTFLSDRQVMDEINAQIRDWQEDFTWREAAAVLEEFNIFTRDGNRQWRFVDRSSQAYFAASAVAHDQSLLNPLLEEVSDYHWRDTLDILVGIVDNPSGLLFELADRDPLVAARCYGLARPPLDQRIQRTLLDTLIERLGRETAEGRAAIASFLGQNPLHNAKPALLEAIRREGRSGVISTLVRAMLPLAGCPPENEEELNKQLAHVDVVQRIDALISLWCRRVSLKSVPAVPDGEDARLDQRITAVMLDPAQPEIVAGVAAIILGLIGSDEARQSLLAAWTRGELPVLLGWCISDGLAQIRHPEVEKAALNSLDSPIVNQSIWAYYVLGWVGTQRQAASQLFQTLKNSKADYQLRGYAAEAIGRLDPPEGRKRLEERISQEEDPWVLRKIILALSMVGTIETVPLLEAYNQTGWVQLRSVVHSAISEIRRRFDVN